MYDIVKLINQIYRKFPPKFWYTILFFIILLFMAKPLFNTVTGIINPPLPTETSRPTPRISQSGRIGEALHVLDTYYTLTGYQEYDSACVPLDQSELNEPEKTVIVEFFARNFGNETVELSGFYLRDSSGRNYSMSAGTSVENYRGKCTEPVSEGISRPAAEFSIAKGYGSHFYFYSRNVPRTAEGLEFSFLIGYSIPYPAAGTVTTGSSKVFIPLESPGTFTEPPAVMLGVPDAASFSDGRTAISGSIALAVNDVNRIAGDNDRTLYYLEMLFKNISGKMIDANVSTAFEFAVVDDYGVAMPAETAMNSGYNASFAPEETQKYYLRWTMEQRSAELRNLYLRIRQKEQPDVFIRIPFKQSMLVEHAETPTAAVYLYRTPVPQPHEAETPAPASAKNSCVNTLPPLLKPGDTAAVTYTPPVANRLRKQPGLSGGISGLLNPESVFYVMDGPVCADGLYWYYVSFNGTYGWTAESGEGLYWLEKR